jgi:hypothetical protein
MSLDVYLYDKSTVMKKGTGVFIRENGKNRELTIEEVIKKYPDADVVEQEYNNDYVFESNITHNLGIMAKEAGIYQACWRPEEINAEYASDIIPLLEKGLKDLKAKPEHYKQFNASNGWGSYEHFVPWVEEYLNACKQYPNAKIEVSR